MLPDKEIADFALRVPRCIACQVWFIILGKNATWVPSCPACQVWNRSFRTLASCTRNGYRRALLAKYKALQRRNLPPLSVLTQLFCLRIIKAQDDNDTDADALDRASASCIGAEQAWYNHQFNWWSKKETYRKVNEPPMLEWKRSANHKQEHRRFCHE